MNSLFTSQFNYCPLAWMFHSRAMNYKTNHLHGRCLSIVRSDKTPSFKKHLETDRSVPIYISLQQGFSKKVKIWLLPVSIKFFQNEVSYVPNVKTTFYGTESLSYLGPKFGI